MPAPKGYEKAGVLHETRTRPVYRKKKSDTGAIIGGIILLILAVAIFA